MIQQTQLFPQPRLFSPLPHHTVSPQKLNVYFSYQSSPQPLPQQNLITIKEMEESHKRKRIFSPRKKLSYQEISRGKKRPSRSKIFQQPKKRIQTMKSHIFLKDSVISKAQSIVDQLQELQETSHQMNPINRKLSYMKNRHSKAIRYSKTAKNSLLFSKELIPPKLNKIESDVLSYQFTPNPKQYSSVTIKNQKDNRSYNLSKFSNGLTIFTPENKFLSEFHDREDVQTPKYHKSSYRSMRRSLEPSPVVEFKKKDSLKKITQSTEINNQPTDRFYDDCSVQTPRLPMASKKVSYELIDPLSSSLKKQKLQRKQQQRKLSQISQLKKPVDSNKCRKFLQLIISVLTKLIQEGMTHTRKSTEACGNFIKSEMFFLILIIILSLAIFGIQLVH